MKHSLLLQTAVLPIIFWLFLISTLCGCSSRQNDKTGLEGKVMPSFNILLSDSSTHFSTAEIAFGTPIVLFDFGPYCPYSRAEMEDIITNMKNLKNVRFYLFTTAQFPDMRNFYNNYRLNNYSNVKVGIDYTHFFENYFKVPGVPYLAMYDSQKRLKQVLVGKSDASLIKDILLN